MAIEISLPKNTFLEEINHLSKEPFPKIYPKGILYEDRYQKIYNIIADFNDSQREYFVRDTGARVGIVVIKDDCILLVRQYRLFLNDISYEIPGGKVDDGESPENAVVRECLEETGIRCLNPVQLIFYHLALDAAYNPTYIFYTSEISHNMEPGKIHNDEVIGSEWVPLKKCMDMILNGRILDSFTLLSVLAYHSLKKDMT